MNLQKCYKISNGNTNQIAFSLVSPFHQSKTFWIPLSMSKEEEHVFGDFICEMHQELQSHYESGV
jgi:hypothetical protein